MGTFPSRLGPSVITPSRECTPTLPQAVMLMMLMMLKVMGMLTVHRYTASE